MKRLVKTVVGDLLVGLIALSCGALAGLVLSGCGGSVNPPPAIVTAIGAFQTAAITANATCTNGTPVTASPGCTPQLSQSDANVIVTWTKGILTTLQAAASGWAAALNTGWSQFVSGLPATIQTKFAQQIGALSLAIAVVVAVAGS